VTRNCKSRPESCTTLRPKFSTYFNWTVDARTWHHTVDEPMDDANIDSHDRWIFVHRWRETSIWKPCGVHGNNARTARLFVANTHRTTMQSAQLWRTGLASLTSSTIGTRWSRRFTDERRKMRRRGTPSITTSYIKKTKFKNTCSQINHRNGSVTMARAVIPSISYIYIYTGFVRKIMQLSWYKKSIKNIVTNIWNSSKYEGHSHTFASDFCMHGIYSRSELFCHNGLDHFNVFKMSSFRGGLDYREQREVCRRQIRTVGRLGQRCQAVIQKFGFVLHVFQKFCCNCHSVVFVVVTQQFGDQLGTHFQRKKQIALLSGQTLCTYRHRLEGQRAPYRESLG